MTRFAAFNLLFVAWATRSAAQTAPGDVPNDTIFLYKDTACNSFISSYTMDDVFDKCTNVGTVAGFAVGDIDGCTATQPGYHRQFSLWSGGCVASSSDDGNVRGGGCNGQTCIATQNPDSVDMVASWLSGASISSQGF